MLKRDMVRNLKSTIDTTFRKLELPINVTAKLLVWVASPLVPIYYMIGSKLRIMYYQNHDFTELHKSVEAAMQRPPYLNEMKFIKAYSSPSSTQEMTDMSVNNREEVDKREMRARHSIQAWSDISYETMQ